MNFIMFNVCGVVLTVVAVHSHHRHNKPCKSTTTTASGLPFNFNYNCSNLNVIFNNLPSLVNYNIILVETGEKLRRKELIWTKDKSKKCFSIVKNDKEDKSNHKLMSIYLEMETEAGWCKNITIFEDLSANRNQSAAPEYKYKKECCSCPNCIIEVDLKNEFTDSVTKNTPTETTTTTASDTPSTGQQSKHPPIAVLIYVITTVIVMCFIILVIYICVKKYCHRNSEPIEAIELNTYATTKEVLYADLSLTRGDSRPPTHEEEATYAKIIGVMKPVDGNVKDK